MTSRTAKKNDSEPVKKHCSISISERLYEILEDHIALLKVGGRQRLNKREWLKEAVEECLEEERKSGEIKIPRRRNISFILNEEQNERINARVEVIKEAVGIFSKKKWLIEVIEEKLERERDIVEKVRKKLLS